MQRWVKSFTLSSDFKQYTCMHFGIISKLQCHEKIGNIKLICLKILVVAVWIPVWMYVKRQGCEWNISVLKISLKIEFEFRFQRINTSCGAMFGILKNTLLVSSAVLAVWILISVSVKYLSI